MFDTQVRREGDEAFLKPPIGRRPQGGLKGCPMCPQCVRKLIHPIFFIFLGSSSLRFV